MSIIMIVIAHILFFAGIVFTIGEICANIPKKMFWQIAIPISWTPFILFIGAAVAKYLAS